MNTRHWYGYSLKSRHAALRWMVTGAIFFGLGSWPVRASQVPEAADVEMFFRAADSDPAVATAALENLRESWQDSYASMLLDVTRFVSQLSPRGARIIAFLEDQTGQTFGTDVNAWLRWTWSLPYDPHPDYALLKAALFTQIDQRMAEFFTYSHQATIRLDEVQWGGVRINGIPPLDHPQLLSASEAGYLADSDVVFGVALNGSARAYPKRILGWHEMALDELGGVELTIIYCTLCGTVLPYESEVEGRLFRFGTSGLLYRSNKLFFDEGTRSLWSTLEGRPVIGALVGEGLGLRLRSSVTTTWGEWKRQHPDTTVLSLETGYERDYSEGAAYRDYFSTDELMFEVPETDDRLRNKDEVVVLFVEPEGGERIPVALATDLLTEYPIYPFEVGGQSLVVVTSREGANRIYSTGDVSFSRKGDAGNVVDDRNRVWNLSEDALTNGQQELLRVGANRAFWFGWYAQFPDTVLHYED